MLLNSPRHSELLLHIFACWNQLRTEHTYRNIALDCNCCNKLWLIFLLHRNMAWLELGRGLLIVEALKLREEGSRSTTRDAVVLAMTFSPFPSPHSACRFYCPVCMCVVLESFCVSAFLLSVSLLWKCEIVYERYQRKGNTQAVFSEHFQQLKVFLNNNR